MFSSIMGTTYDNINKFVTSVHGANSGRALAQSISIPVGVIMHLNVLRFELDDRNKCDAVPGAVMLADIDISQLFFMRSTCNQDDSDS